MSRKLLDLLDEEEMVAIGFVFFLAIVNLFFPMLLSLLAISLLAFVLFNVLTEIRKSNEHSIEVRQKELEEEMAKLSGEEEDY